MSGPPSITACALALCVAWSSAATASGLSPLDEALLADARDGSFDRFDLPSACLVAGGVADEQELVLRRRQLAEACAAAVRSTLRSSPQDEQVRQLLQVLHDRVLIGKYDRTASDLRRMLAAGDYNCLSALVIYHEVCSQAGVPLTLWAVPGHVYGQVGPTRIEPTCRHWPPPSLAAATGSPPRQITPLALVGRFYYNRGVQLLEERRFEAGIAAMQAACQFDPGDAEARANLLAGLNNWAIELSRENRPAAAALVARGLAIDPQFAPLVVCERYLQERIAPRQELVRP